MNIFSQNSKIKFPDLYKREGLLLIDEDFQKFLEDVDNSESDRINKKLNTLNLNFDDYNKSNMDNEEYEDQPPGCVHQ